jgi:hypothetical protein
MEFTTNIWTAKTFWEWRYISTYSNIENRWCGVVSLMLLLGGYHLDPGWSSCSLERKSFLFPRNQIHFLGRPSCSSTTASTEVSDQKHGKYYYPMRIDRHAVIFLRRHFLSGAHNIMAACVSTDWILCKGNSRDWRNPRQQQWRQAAVADDEYGWHAMWSMRSKCMGCLISVTHWAHTVQICNTHKPESQEGCCWMEPLIRNCGRSVSTMTNVWMTMIWTISK